MSGERVRACGHWIGPERRHCKEADGVRVYLIGLRCPAHTPNALKGLTEIPPTYRAPTPRSRRPLTAVRKTT